MFVQKSSDNKEGIRPVTKVATQQLIDALKRVLSDEVKFYFKAHGYHWNVKGADFSQYHELFAEIYEDVYGAIDPTAENILKLGSDAPFKLMDFQMYSSIQDTTVGSEPNAMAVDLLSANEQMVSCLNNAFGIANNENEQGIANFLAERIDMHQKWGWQLRSSAGLQK